MKATPFMHVHILYVAGSWVATKHYRMACRGARWLSWKEPYFRHTLLNLQFWLRWFGAGAPCQWHRSVSTRVTYTKILAPCVVSTV